MLRVCSVVLLLLVAAACTRFLEGPPTLLPGLDEPRWYEPDYPVDKWRSPNKAGPGPIAISEDGSKIAFAIPGLTETGIVLHDLTLDQTILFKDKSPVIEYVDPTFSADSKRIAFIATPIPQYGIGEVWIADVEGNYQSRIAEPGRSYRGAQFHPKDPDLIAYYKDIFEARNPAVHPELRSERSFFPFDVFEYDLGGRTETRWKSDGAGWAGISRIDYDASGEVLILKAFDELRRNAYGSLSRVLHSTPSELKIYGRGTHILTRTGAPNASSSKLEHLETALIESGGKIASVSNEGPVVVHGPTEKIPPFSFKWILTPGNGKPNATIFDTRTDHAHNIEANPDLNMTKDLCTLAYWSTGEKGDEITILRRCAGPLEPRIAISLSDLLGNAKAAAAPAWRLGDVGR